MLFRSPISWPPLRNSKGERSEDFFCVVGAACLQTRSTQEICLPACLLCFCVCHMLLMPLCVLCVLSYTPLQLACLLCLDVLPDMLLPLDFTCTSFSASCVPLCTAFHSYHWYYGDSAAAIDPPEHSTPPQKHRRARAPSQHPVALCKRGVVECLAAALSSTCPARALASTAPA